MPRAKTTSLYNNFVKGLQTESTALTFPANASIDELNTVIERRGNRIRRRGFDYETGAVRNIPGTEAWDRVNGQSQQFLWKAPAFVSGLQFLCLQISNVIYFYDASAVPLSTGRKAFTIDMSTYLAPGFVLMDAVMTGTDMSSGKGYLFITSEVTEPLVVEYTPDTDSITVTQVTVRIRDFAGLYDGLGNDEEPTTLSKEHEYNLHNQGWTGAPISVAGVAPTYWDADAGGYVNYTPRSAVGSGAIQDFYNTFSRYPGNNKQWTEAKALVDAPSATPPQIQGQFLPKVLDKLFAGNNHAPRGHYILDAFNLDRSLVSGIPGILPVVTTQRPTSTCFFSGRVWWSCNSTVYFSQVLDQKQKAGNCYQEADPTSEDISDLIATDGGAVPIPEAVKIIKIVPYRSGVLAFSINGVWQISGTQNGFSATDIDIYKVSPIGCQSPKTIVQTEQNVIYWSDVGIMGVAQASSSSGGAVEGKFQKANITEQTIQSFYQKIPNQVRRNAKGLYDPTSNVIYWMYNSTGSGVGTYDSVLCFDVSLEAFYPWKVSSKDSTGPLLSGFFTLLSNTNKDRSNRPSSTIYLSHDSVGFTFCIPDSLSFTDWKSYDGTGFTYESYLETGYELLGDVSRDKQGTYLTAVFQRTEQNYVTSGADYETDLPSSCYMVCKWNWADKSSSNKWTRQVQVYRFNRFTMVDPTNLAMNSGQSVVTSKNKIRGSGKSIQFRFFSSDAGKDFNLLGWSVSYTGNVEV